VEGENIEFPNALTTPLALQEFGRQSKKYGVAPESLPAFQQLWKAVAPTGKAESIDLS